MQSKFKQIYTLVEMTGQDKYTKRIIHLDEALKVQSG